MVECIVFGPGNDDYGRDNIIDDWQCPSCGNILKLTRWKIHHGSIRCSKCGYANEECRRMDEIFGSLDEKLRRNREREKVEE